MSRIRERPNLWGKQQNASLEATQGQIDGLFGQLLYATRFGWHMWEIDLGFALWLPPGWSRAAKASQAPRTTRDRIGAYAPRGGIKPDFSLQPCSPTQRQKQRCDAATGKAFSLDLTFLSKLKSKSTRLRAGLCAGRAGETERPSQLAEPESPQGLREETGAIGALMNIEHQPRPLVVLGLRRLLVD